MATYKDYINILDELGTRTKEIESFSEINLQISSFKNLVKANNSIFQTLQGVKKETFDVITRSKDNIQGLVNYKEQFQNSLSDLESISTSIPTVLSKIANFRGVSDSSFLNKLEDIKKKIENIQQQTTLNSLKNAINEVQNLNERLNQILGASEVLNMLEFSETRINNAKNVSLEVIKEKIKTQFPLRYDQMLILDEKRTNYYVVKYEATGLERKILDTKFYLREPIKLNFNNNFIGGNDRFGKIQKFENSLPFTKNDVISKNENTFLSDPDLPFYELEIKRTGKKIADNQPYFFIPEKTFKQNCSNCNGVKYLPCRSCNAQHKYRCDTCDNDGKVSCQNCNTSGKVTCKKCAGSTVVDCGKCNGNGFRKCSSCNGKGVNDKGEKCHKCQNGSVRCTNCNNGKVRCEDGFLNKGCGGSGKVNCGNCNGAGRLTCPKCKGERYLYCSYCHGNPNDGETYGKVDCEGCQASGELGFITYVSTDVLNVSDEKVYLTGQLFESDKVVVDNAGKHLHCPQNLIDIYFDVQKEHVDKHIDTTQRFANTLRDLHKLKTNKYPKVLSERMKFEAVPCSTVTYKHILSNTIHTFSVISVDKGQEIIFHSDPKGTLKSTGGFDNFMRKIFSGSRFRSKIDKRNELVLMIYMAKADGIIEDSEKAIIVSSIESLDDFTKSEQDLIFDMMNLPTLPPLDPKYAVFSSLEKENEVKNRLIEFMKADGELETPEIGKLNHISEIIQNARGKRGFFYYLSS